MSVLKIALVGALVVIKQAVIDLYMAGLEIEQRIQHLRFRLRTRLGLVGRSVTIHDEVNLWPLQHEVPQQNTRAPESQHIQCDAN